MTTTTVVGHAVYRVHYAVYHGSRFITDTYIDQPALSLEQAQAWAEARIEGATGEYDYHFQGVSIAEVLGTVETVGDDDLDLS